MKIKVTHPFDKYLAGLVYDVPDKQAKEAIEKEMACEIKEAKDGKRQNLN